MMKNYGSLNNLLGGGINSEDFIKNMKPHVYFFTQKNHAESNEEITSEG